MSTAVITAVSHHHEQQLVSLLDAVPGVTVVRRCADVAELLSTGAAGVAEVAVVSADFRDLDRDALRHLAGHGVRVAGLVTPEGEAAEARLRQLGVSALLTDGSDPTAAAQVIQNLVEGAGRPSQPPWARRGPASAGEERSESTAPTASAAELEELLGDPARTGSGWLSPHGGRAERATATRDRGADRFGSGSDHDGPDVVDDREPRRSPLTAVWGPTGGPGRTTIALTLAAHLAATGVRTLLIDLDTWGASVAQALALVDEAPGVAAAARASEQGTLDSLSLARVAPEVTAGLRVLTGLPRAERWPELRAAAVEDILEKSRAIVDHVVVDCGFSIEDDEELSYDTSAPRRNAATLSAIEASDALLAVGAGDPIGLQRLVRAVQQVGLVPSPPPTVVINKVRATATGGQPEKVIQDVLDRFAGLEHPRFVPWAPSECDAALLTGRTLVEAAPAAAVTRAIADLAPLVHPDLSTDRDRSRRRTHRGLGGRVGRLARR